MDIYNLTQVDTTMDGVRGVLLQGFNIIGIHGRPLVTPSFEIIGGRGRAQGRSKLVVGEKIPEPRGTGPEGVR